jgi:hypothetical protein
MISHKKIIDFGSYDFEVENDEIIEDKFLDNNNDNKNVKFNIYNNIYYVNYDCIDYDKIRIIKGGENNDKDQKYYSIKYLFGGTERDLVILFKNIKLEQSSYKIINSMKYDNLPIDKNNNDYVCKINNIREFINKKISNICKIQNMKLCKNNTSLKHYGKYTKIYKLGMSNENYKNKYLNKKEFQDSLTNYKYNKVNSDRYYLSNMLISFNIIHYDIKNEISIKPCSKMLEYRFIKQSYKSMLEDEERVTTPIKKIISFLE